MSLDQLPILISQPIPRYGEHLRAAQEGIIFDGENEIKVLLIGRKKNERYTPENSESPYFIIYSVEGSSVSGRNGNVPVIMMKGENYFEYRMTKDCMT